MRVLSVVGNRPQFIKSGPLSVALRAAGIDEVVVHTGQHWDAEMSAVFFDELGLPEPAYRLDLRTADPAAMEPPIREAVERERPDWVLVYGDTNSTLAGARGRGRRAGRARRGGAAVVRPLDAGGAQPDRGRPALGASALSRRAVGGAARVGGRRRPARGRRRRHGRRDALLPADRARARGGVGGRPSRTRRSPCTARRTPSRSGCARSSPR